jgi:hypothetical protein
MPSHNRSDPGQGSGPPRYPGTFLLAFREAARRLNWEVRRWLGPAVECVDAHGREQVVGLENLYRRARSEERSTWPELIAEFLSSVPSEQFEPPSDLEAVADRLMVRVGGPLLAESPGKVGGLTVWAQPLVEPNLVLNLVIDYPQSMSYVTADMVANSGRPGQDWVERAVANLTARTPTDCLTIVDADSGLRQCTVGDAYDSSRALLLDTLLPESAADGTLVALPGRDHLLVLPVNAVGLAHVPMLKALAEKFHKTTPYAISGDVFWVRRGSWFAFGIDLQSDRVTVEPPPEFLEVLQRLAPEQADGNASSPPESA